MIRIDDCAYYNPTFYYNLYIYIRLCATLYGYCVYQVCSIHQYRGIFSHRTLYSTLCRATQCMMLVSSYRRYHYYINLQYSLLLVTIVPLPITNKQVYTSSVLHVISVVTRQPCHYVLCSLYVIDGKC